MTSLIMINKKRMACNTDTVKQYYFLNDKVIIKIILMIILILLYDNLIEINADSFTLFKCPHLILQKKFNIK